ncbi:MAG: single-stranded-DNA-specific exonuclease RecJ, partial [Opitutales bacterium]|nr:single-stranded-DNA-specific exonuclease RecJ [Opitutales bacterium]
MRWTHREQPSAIVAELAGELHLSTAAATLLCSLGFDDCEAARRFMNPMLRELDDPFAITNMGAAVARIRAAMFRNESIAVFGDYDVDGVTSTVFLLGILDSFGVHPRYLVPRRMEEGYGLSRQALERMLSEGRPDLLIAVDCGTNSVEEAAWLRSQGVDLVILDHHTSREQGNADKDAILVNPHVFDGEDKPWSQLCTVGLVFKFAHALIKQMREEGDEAAMRIDLKEYLDLVAMGTVADLVPLLGENRILARKGLERMSNPSRTGLEALYEVAGMQIGQAVTPFDVSFRLSPRINASGRLAEASTAVDMLMGRDWTRCLEEARTLDSMNSERQEIERGIAAEAIARVDELYADAPAFVLHSADWHQGVVGIVASRIAHHYNKPAVVLGTEESGLYKGSGRSVAGVDLVAALGACDRHLEAWGGHPMAVGVSLKADRLDAFRELFCKAVEAQGASLPTERELEIACWLSPSEINDDLFRELDDMGPFGQGNPQPLFGVRGIRLTHPATAFGGGHCRFFADLGRGQSISCVAWRMGDCMPPPSRKLDLAARLTWN